MDREIPVKAYPVYATMFSNGASLCHTAILTINICINPPITAFMQNLSCREKPSLDWNSRMQIELGTSLTSSGLLYLHELNPKIIHRDDKAANILLDESFEAAVGDFGLAKLLDQMDSHVTIAVRGTVGYIALEPEGFGCWKWSDSKRNDLRLGKILYEEKRLEVLVDKDLNGCFDVEELETMAEVALLCTQANPNMRPKMVEVVKVLEGIVEHEGNDDKVQGGTLTEEMVVFLERIMRSMKSLHSSLSCLGQGERTLTVPCPLLNFVTVWYFTNTRY